MITLLFTPALKASPEKNKIPLNVLVITIDTLRSDKLSCYSPEAPLTPHIDKLAEKGVLFTRAFAHNTLTLPSHTNIFLGTTPLAHGVHTNTLSVVNDSFVTMAEFFRTAGFQTGAFIGGSTLDSRFGLDQGFDVYDDDFKIRGAMKFFEAERPAEIVVGRSIGWLQKAQPPWFLWVHLFDPHFPYEPPEPYRTEYSQNLYDGEVVYADSTVGRLLEFLEKIQQDKSTIIILTSDHGESLGDHGEMTHGIMAYNPTLWIPLIISSPGLKPRQVSQLVSHIDVFPTLCDLLGMGKPSFLQGLSLVPAAKGKKLPLRRIFFESLYPYYEMGWAPLTGYIENSMKFIDSPIPELFDLYKDFGESHNLIQPPNAGAYRENLSELKKSLSNRDENLENARINPNLMEKLRSLGYISSKSGAGNQRFGPSQDAKTLLPIYNHVTSIYSQREKISLEQSVSQLEQIIQTPNCIDQAYNYLSQIHFESGRLNKALEVLKAGLERFPDSYETLRLYSGYLLEAEEYTAMIQLLENHESINKEHDPYVWLQLGIAYLKNQQQQKAMAALEKAIAIDDEYVDAYQNLGALHLSRWLTQNDEEDYDRSVELFNKVIEIDPENSGAYTSRGVAYIQWGRIESAIKSWEEAVHLSPDAGKTYYYLGLAYLSKGDKPKAYMNFSRYKEKYYSVLSKEDQQKLDSLIKTVRDN
jgi:arylsulfatase A-like enzyme/Tfp pilus assembly protein PilF